MCLQRECVHVVVAHVHGEDDFIVDVGVTVDVRACIIQARDIMCISLSVVCVCVGILMYRTQKILSPERNRRLNC